MTPQRRTALVSIGAAAVFAAMKLGAGLVSGSRLVSEALHSGTDLVAALLTFFAIGVSGRPADEGHQYGHGKAEHLAALAEATVLALVSVAVAALAVTRLTGGRATGRHGGWLFVVVAIVLGSTFRAPSSRSARLAGTAAKPCARTRSTSGATSRARSRCSRASVPRPRATRGATRSRRSSLRLSSSRRRPADPSERRRVDGSRAGRSRGRGPAAIAGSSRRSHSPGSASARPPGGRSPTS